MKKVAQLGMLLALAGCEQNSLKSKQAKDTRTKVLLTASVPSSAGLAPKKPCQAQEITLPKVAIVSREQWGAKPPSLEILEGMPHCSNLPIRKITIHNTEEATESLSEQEVMRLVSAQMLHMNPRFKKNWGDIAYHYLVGPSGKIYEGRNPGFRGDSGTHYYPDNPSHSHTPQHHLLIAVIGNYDLQKLTAATRISLSNLISANLVHYNLSSKDVLSHSEIAHTDCPGKELRTWLKAKPFRTP